MVDTIYDILMTGKKTHDYLIFDLLVTFLNCHGCDFINNITNLQHIDHVFCTALVAYFLTDTRIMSNTTKLKICTPDYFAQDIDRQFMFGKINSDHYLERGITIKKYISELTSGKCIIC